MAQRDPVWHNGDPVSKLSADWMNRVTSLLNASPGGSENASGSRAIPAVAIVRVDEPLAGGGYYAGRYAAKPRKAFSAESDLAVADWVKNDLSSKCVIVNWLEEGESTHLLTDAISGASDNSGFPAIHYGYVTVGEGEDEATLPAFHIVGSRWKSCPEP